MSGRYENFPRVIHGVAWFACKSSTIKVQKAILDALYFLNNEQCCLDVITPYLSEKCQVSFEFGIAEDFDFIFLDGNELDRFKRVVVEKKPSTLDFFCVVRYYILSSNGKRVPLKFDYHLLRFMFHKKRVELLICHERGTQRVSLEELIIFVTKRINKQLSEKRLRSLNLEYLRSR